MMVKYYKCKNINVEWSKMIISIANPAYCLMIKVYGKNWLSHTESLRSVLLLTPSVHAQQGLQYLVVCVCLCVCLSVKSHFTSRVSVCPENTVAYSAGNGGQKICVVFFETALFKSYGVKRKQKS